MGKRVNGKRFNTVEGAKAEYRRLKKIKICEAAELYRDVLTERAYMALINYEPKI